MFGSYQCRETRNAFFYECLIDCKGTSRQVSLLFVAPVVWELLRESAAHDFRSGRGWMGPERYALLAGCDFTLLPSRPATWTGNRLLDCGRADS